MKSSLLSLFTLLFSVNLSAQTATIELSNRSPRVGDEVEPSVSVDFMVEAIGSQLDQRITMDPNSKGMHGNGEHLIRTLTFPQPGEYVVGPFTFQFNGKQIATNSIRVTVDEALPFEPGVWVRLVKDGNQKFIIVEQMIANRSDFKKTDNGFTFTSGGVREEAVEFAEIEEHPAKGVTINFRKSRSFSRTPPDTNVFAAGFSYSIKEYEVELDPNFKGKFVLKESHYVNLPRTVKVQDILISN